MIPEKLVTAAAEAMHIVDFDGRCHCGVETERNPDKIRRHQAELALAAAFAALPECDEIIISLGGDLPHNRATVRNVFRNLANEMANE